MAPQETKNRPKKGRRGCKNDPKPQVEPRSAPRRPQDRPGSSPGGDSHLFPPPPGAHLGAQKRPKTEPKNNPKSKRKSRSEQKRSKRIKDLSWSDLGRFGGAMWEPGDPKSVGKRNISCKFTFSKIRRFEEGSGNHLSGKKRQEERK